MIGRLAARMPVGEPVELGPGDDAAVIRTAGGRVVATTDMLIEGRHFRLDWSSGYDVGRKAAAQNLADVVAMGARPTALLIGFAAPPTTQVAFAEAVADGLRDECALVGASVAGGDTVSAPLVMISVTALGDPIGPAVLTRSAARPGDLVAVRGELGRSAAGLELLLAGRTEPAELVAAHLRPTPPYAAGAEALRAGATTLMDVSDGLVQDLGHIASASGVGITLSGTAIKEFGPDPRHVLTGGEDHAFAGTFPPEAVLEPGWRIVGRVIEGTGVTVDGTPYERRGWDHFRQ